jgi:hypothetical protein
MKPILISLRKRKWVKIIFSIVLIIVLLLSWVTYQLNKLGGVLESSAFADYVSSVYIPAERRRSGKWPTTLDGLPGYFKSHKDSTPLFDYAVDYYHYKRFRHIEVIKITPEYFLYRLHTNDWTPVCQSTVNPDDGNCWDDTPQNKKDMGY